MVQAGSSRVGRPWGGRWLGLDHLLAKCALALLAAQATGCLFGSGNMTELFIIYVGAKNDLALGEWTSPLEGATRATPEATDNIKNHEATTSREHL
jgi:hypothetical protein